jgi:hypothetical protein
MKAGAAHVTGIETRQHLVANAEETFEHYSVPGTAICFSAVAFSRRHAI